MKCSRFHFALLAIVFLLLSAPSLAAKQAKYESTRVVARTLPLEGTLHLDHKLGDVSIRAHDRPTVVLSAKIRAAADSQQQADELARLIDVEIRTPGSDVRVETKYPEQRSRRNISFRVDYEIVMPARSPLRLETSFGDVSVEGLRARADITGGHGLVSVRDIGAAVKIDSRFGAIDVSNIRGNAVISNQNGKISARGISGEARITDRFGEVRVDNAGSLIVENGNGAIIVSDVKGSARLESSFGAIRVSDVGGGLKVTNQNGSVQVEKVSGDAFVATSFGKIDVKTIGGPAVLEARNSKIDARDISGELKVDNTFGAVRVTNIGRGAVIDNSNGDVHASDVRGDLSVKNRFGLVEASNITGRVDVDASNGAVKVDGATRGVDLGTTFGGVFVKNVSGPVTIDNENGSVEAALLGRSQCDPVAIQTTFGAIRIALPHGSSWDVDAKTSFGRINTTVPVTISGQTGQTLRGTIGSGGCKLSLGNSNGGIDITTSR